MRARVAAIVLAVLVAGCTSAVPSQPPTAAPPTAIATPSQTAIPTATPTPASATPAPRTLPPPSPAPATPAPSAPRSHGPVIVTSPEPFSPTSCPLPRAATTAWPSDRLRTVVVRPENGGEVVEFQFDPPSTSQPGGNPTVTLGPVSGPFTMAGSGAPVDVEGNAFLGIRFDHLTLVDDAGNPTFNDERDIKAAQPIVKEVIVTDESEGVMTWIIGLEFAGCASMSILPADRLIRLTFSNVVA